MKSIKILLGVVGAFVVMSMAAFADDLQLVTVYNGHGQGTQLFRGEDRYIGLFAGGTSVGTNNGNEGSGLTLQIINRGHGELIYLYRQSGM